MKLDKTIKEQVEECYKHIIPFLPTPELKEMCKRCEAYCGKEHDYEECRDKPCFIFWLAFEYLSWSNSYIGSPDMMGKC